MRRRLALLSLATTTLVVISFLVPLGLLVRRQAADRARDAGEREAQAAASLIALAAAFDADPDAIAATVEPLGPGLIVAFANGEVLGEPLTGQGALIGSARDSQSTIAAEVEGGWELALPVIGRDSIVVVDVLVATSAQTEGVAAAWLLLGFLGLALVFASTLLADRLGRRLVEPIVTLAHAAHDMAAGDLATRVQIDDPPEIREVGAAFNTLAARLVDLLAEERESVADLSHRLRTPLTSLRLQAERVDDGADRTSLLTQVDRLEVAIDQMILDARRGVKSGVGTCRLDEVVGGRLAFWRILAEEQGRRVDTSLTADAEVGLEPATLETMIDILIGNVFTHTDTGTAFAVSTSRSADVPRLVIADEGRGFANRDLIDRGVSGAGSTGLGLDIVRRSAEMVGGSLEVDDRPGGGAVVTILFG